jgi:predicted nucleic acid-binding protein
MKLYFDSMLWIYYLEGHPIFGPPAHSFVNRIRSAHHDLLSSHLVLAEVLVLPKKNRDVFTTTKYLRYFQSSAVSLIPLSSHVAERFADIRESTRVKPADAPHLALAASAETDYFVTTDTKLHSLTVPGIAHIAPPDAVP